MIFKSEQEHLPNLDATFLLILENKDIMNIEFKLPDEDTDEDEVDL